MLLVDTTVWIDHFAGRTTFQTESLKTAILKRKSLCLCGPIVSEVLQGITNIKEYHQVFSLLNRLTFIDMHQATFVAAAEIYRKLRKRGITIRKTINCMIAAAAIENDIPLLHNDRDFDPIQKYCGLEIYKDGI